LNAKCSLLIFGLKTDPVGGVKRY